MLCQWCGQESTPETENEFEELSHPIFQALYAHKVGFGCLKPANNASTGLSVRTCKHGVYLDNQACFVCEPEAFESASR